MVWAVGPWLVVRIPDVPLVNKRALITRMRKLPHKATNTARRHIPRARQHAANILDARAVDSMTGPFLDSRLPAIGPFGRPIGPSRP